MSVAEDFREGRFWRFLLVGAVCYAVNIVILFLGVEFWGLPYQVMMVVSIVAVNFLGWVLHRNWVFLSRVSGIFLEFCRYFSANVVSMLISFGLMVVLVDCFGVHYLLANVGVACGMVFLNFVLHKRFSFSGRWGGGSEA